MATWVLRAPHQPGMRLPRYVRRVEDGRAELVLHMVEAKKFTEARHAVAWAASHGELLLDFVVCRTP